MNRPDSMKKYKELDLKLGIKSSISDVKSVIALALLLWECTDCPAELIYSEDIGGAIKLANDVEKKFQDFLIKLYDDENSVTLFQIETINENPLFKLQMEPLIVPLELIWKLAKVSFVDESKATSAERKGGIRYPKKLQYSVNADIIHSLINSDYTAYMKIIMSWCGFAVEIDHAYEKNLTSLLTAISESAVYKLVDGEKDVIFHQNNVYEKIIDTNDAVDINGDKEAKGSLRILKSLLTNGMNSYLNFSSGNVTADESNSEKLPAYQQRVDTFLFLSATKVLGFDDGDLTDDDTEDTSTETLDEKTLQSDEYTNKIIDISLSRNRIIFGAPGTGKSFLINDKRKALLSNGGEYERVTFHPDYSYAQFVGTYKPTMIEKVQESGQKTSSEISYEYVPGPFMRTLVKSYKNPHLPFLLIIEEINRANVAAVFGDVFQLLDRDDDENSEYPIQTTEDMRKYLAKELGGLPSDYSEMKIPSNMFIWATMNSADQGVFPMDTAFKRRWDFTYIGVDSNDYGINGKTVILGKGQYERSVEWNALRKAINRNLLSYKINEDKLLGPYFISKKVLGEGAEMSADVFIRVFKNKVLMYLFEDAAKQKRQSLFTGCDEKNLYSSICEEFDTKGVFIFDDNIYNLFPKNQQGESV